MIVLIVGGDQVESLKRQVIAQGYTEVEHWNGRKKGFLKRTFSNHTRLIVMVCDYINHGLAISLRNKASRKGIPLIYCRHSIHELRHKLLNLEEASDGCCPCYSF